MYHPNGPPNPNDKMYQMYLENVSFKINRILNR